MGKIQEKWRDSVINIDDIILKNAVINSVVSYPPAGNDVFECKGLVNGKKCNFIIKSERGSFADFENEIKVLDALKNKFLVPKVIESGNVNSHTYIVLSKINGDKLSDIFKEQHNVDKNRYLYTYGKQLAEIHNYVINWAVAKMRNINDVPSKVNYSFDDDWENSIVNYLIKNKPAIVFDTFIHGDFHYGNILWKNYKITGILDWEYSGLGFKEQDIAWALILRPGQKFMDNLDDYDSFLEGYKSCGSYDNNKLKWALINGLMHFYLMNKNKNDKEYLNSLKGLINTLMG